IQPPSDRPGILYYILVGQYHPAQVTGSPSQPMNYRDYFTLNQTTAELRVLQPISRDVHQRFTLIIKTKDPALTIVLDDYTAIFRLSAAGIERYLLLLKPVDREQQTSYTFTSMLTQPSYPSIHRAAEQHSTRGRADSLALHKLNLTAVDIDEGVNGLVTYEILAGALGDFVISRRTGRITVAMGVALVVGRSYTLTVKASDGAPGIQR
ncbi:hypothetical protein CRUP_026365, partial [Coryphaenoides rupestris]